jgi:dienelactone hydrolase
MNKLIVLVFCLVATIGSSAQDSATYVRRSAEVLEFLKQEKFQLVIDRLDSSVAAKLDSARLGAAWRNLLKRGGPFNGVADTLYDHQPTFDVVIFQCLFGARKVDVKTVYGRSGILKGIFFTATDEREKYADPPYYRPELFEEVPGEVRNGDVRLKSVLTVPKNKGRVPAVILVHGSGPNDKDETVGATKIFRDFAVGLSANGVAVLRYDKRTRAQAALLMRTKKILTPEEETVSDAVAAAELLKKDPRIDTTRIYLVGHSMGAYLLPQVADRTPFVKGLILLCPNGRPLQDAFVDQGKYVLSSDDTKSDAEKKHIIDSLETEARKINALTRANAGDSARILGLHPAYWVSLKGYDAPTAARSVGKPILALFGSRDYQVTEADLSIWKNGLKGMTEATFKTYPDLNHFYVIGSGKSRPAEYFKTGNVEEQVVKDIAGWISNGRLPE